MNFKSIDYFLTVAREQSITKAASLLHITQQTLSADIAALERELGHTLFLRRVPLQLTYAGEVFLRYAEEFQQSRRTMEREFADISGSQKGILRIGVTFARGRALMPPLIAAFQQQYPRMEIHLVEATNEQLHQHLMDGSVDLAIANLPQSANVVLHPFYRENWILLAADLLLERLWGRRRTEMLQRLQAGDFSPLADCPFVLGIPDDIGGSFGRQFLRQQRLQPPVKAQSENLDTLLDLCVMGIGACFAPDNLIPSSLAHLHRITLPNAEYQLYFGIKKGGYQWKMVDAFVETALQCFPELTRNSIPQTEFLPNA